MGKTLGGWSLLPPIRIAIAGVPRLLREITLTALSDQEDMEVVAELPDRQDLPNLVRTLGVDIVIVSCSESEVTELGNQLIGEYRSTRMLAITDGGRSGYLYELRPRKAELGELTPGVLIRAISEAVRRSTA
jgi:DNA-binding NarL/FixJ family response regulator